MFLNLVKFMQIVMLSPSFVTYRYLLCLCVLFVKSYHVMMVSSRVAEEAVLWKLKYVMDLGTVMTALMKKTAVRKKITACSCCTA